MDYKKVLEDCKLNLYRGEDRTHRAGEPGLFYIPRSIPEHQVENLYKRYSRFKSDMFKIAIDKMLSELKIVPSKVPYSNLCGEIELPMTGITRMMFNMGSAHIEGRPYPNVIRYAQNKYVARACFRLLYPAHEDRPLIEVLGHIDLNQKLLRRFTRLTRTPIVRTILFDFYNENRRFNWWGEFRLMSRNITLSRHGQEFIEYLAKLLWDAGHGPTTFLSQWRTSEVLGVLKNMRTTEDFSAMPILADALQDAGCDNEQLLSHYRDPNALFSLGSWIFRASGLL